MTAYLTYKLPANTYSDNLLADFDYAVALALPTSEFGDMLISMQIAIDGDFLSAWVVPAARLKNAEIVASRVVQERLRVTHRRSL